MFNIVALMTICVVYGVIASPTVLYSKPLVVQEHPMELPGIANLAEKSLPSLESQRQSISPLPGTKNNAEKAQIESGLRRGSANLAEKEIPVDILDLYYRSQ